MSLAQGFHRHIQTIFVAELEAVRHCFGGGIDGYSQPIPLNMFNAVFVCFVRHLNANWSRAAWQLWKPAANADGHPKFVRGLRGEIVETQGGQEADDKVRPLGQKRLDFRHGADVHVFRGIHPLAQAFKTSAFAMEGEQGM